MDIFMMRNASLRHCRQIPRMDRQPIERQIFYDVISANFTSGCLQEVLLMQSTVHTRNLLGLRCSTKTQ